MADGRRERHGPARWLLGRLIDRDHHDHCTYDDCPSDELDHASR
ncbi:MAG TPA: hypothetical protein P5193_03350 [Microthrixaceae bacterium]|nr:hypothetical protein [Microthrixaceae bacterium]HMX06645.1 hypothetical protein [Microthrixaceae bacterium]HMX64788.1 hypothetical protein [Microthrixaceae bacterium]HMY88224.1 hypothetical protein [Microthrixaceae bacterium]HNA36164.1 hypothetical protein [Microthrixaceae bacterium]